MKNPIDYPNVPDVCAKGMLKDLIDLENKRQSTRADYLKKFGKILPSAKALRFAQVEARLDLVVRLQMASAIPPGIKVAEASQPYPPVG